MSPDAVTIVEVSPRDGLQSESEILPTAVKIELIARLVEAGLRRIEATSFVHPKRVPQMADAEAVIAGLPRRADLAYIGLALNERGFDRAIAAGVDEVGFAVIASDTFNRRNQGASIEESITAWRRIASAARGAGVTTSIMISAAFGCPFEGEVPAARVLAIAEEVMQSDPDEIALADTIGVATPWQVKALIEQLKAIVGDTPLRCHFHNTRNTGLANAFAAIEAGVATLDASTGGIGGCPFAPAATGNIATEDLVYMLHRADIPTGVSMPGILETAQWLGEQLGRPVPSMLSRAGNFP